MWIKLLIIFIAMSFGAGAGEAIRYVPFSKFEATAAPTVNDNASLGYDVGSVWVDKLNLESYRLVGFDLSGNAIWINTTLTTDELASIAVSGNLTDATNWGTVAEGQVLQFSAGNVEGLTLADVATSGDYNDLVGTPALATIATSGLYSDIDFTGIAVATVAATDQVLVLDADDGSLLKYVTAQSIADLAISFPVTNEADNRIITSDGAGGGNAEANLTFDGSVLTLGTGNSIYWGTSATARIIGNSGATPSALQFFANGGLIVKMGRTSTLGAEGGGFFIKESSSAQADDASFGQLWVKNDTPNTLWFTNDAGTDYLVSGDYSEYPEIATPSTPATGYGRIYFKTDGKPYALDDLGTEYDLTSAVGDLTGITSLQVDNINIDGNTISSTDVAGTLSFGVDGYANQILLRNDGIIALSSNGGTGTMRFTQTNSGFITSGSASLSLGASSNYQGTFFIGGFRPYTTGKTLGSAGSTWAALYVDNVVIDDGFVEFGEQITPATPATGYGRIYFKTDGKPYAINDLGTEYDLTAGASSGDVFKVGTPVDNQIAIWTGDGTIEGTANLTWNSTTLGIGATTSPGVVGIGLQTSDTADNGGLTLFGGGAALSSRGARINIYGNEHATLPGRIQFYSSGSSGAQYQFFYGVSDSLSALVETDGDWNFNQNNLDNVSSIFITEKAAADADVATYGQLWVKNDVPNTLWFTDDVGTDMPLVGTKFNAQNGTTYTAAMADRNNTITMNNASANTLTVPPNSTTAFPIGTEIIVIQKGAGQTTIAAGAGVTLNSDSGKLKISARYASAVLIKESTDTWYVIGSLSA